MSEPLEPTDVLIKNYVKDSAQYIECWIYQDIDGNQYKISMNQDGDESIEEY